MKHTLLIPVLLSAVICFLFIAYQGSSDPILLSRNAIQCNNGNLKNKVELDLITYEPIALIAPVPLAQFNMYPTRENEFICKNHDQQIDAKFTSDEFEISTYAMNPQSNISIKFMDIHKNGKSQNQCPAEIEVNAMHNKLQYQINENVTIEYVNSNEGIRQNFYISEKPDGENLLQLDLELITAYDPLLMENSISFIAGTGDQMRVVCSYSDLKAWDANGKILNAQMELSKDEDGEAGYLLALVVDDREAVYPLTVDPVATGVIDWSVSTYQAGSFFGSVFSNAGDVNGDNYDDVVVGAYGYNTAFTDAGRVYIYFGSASGPALTPSQTFDGSFTNSNLGKLVNRAGDVNSDGYDDVIIASGSPRIYYGSAAGAVFGDYLTTGLSGGITCISPAGDINGDGYDDVIMGAKDADNGITDEGLVAVWLGSAIGMVLTPHIIYQGEQLNAQLGWSVSGGDYNGDGYSDIAMSANEYDNGQTDEGIVYVCYGSVAGLNVIPDWSREGNKVDAFAGYSISSGDVNNDGYDELCIAIPGYDDSTSKEGLIEIYYGAATGISSSNVYQHYYYSTESSDFAYVNIESDINGDGYHDLTLGDIIADAMRPGDYAIIPGSANGIYNENAFRLSVGYAAGGDFNNDGFEDVLCDIPGETVQLLNGSEFPIPADLTDFITGDQSNAQSGFNVASAGDVNDDGFEDILIGAPYFDSTFIDEGKVSLYLGNAAGTFISPVWVKYGQQVNAKYGWSVSTAGDINADGYDDIIIGSPGYDNLYVDEGRIQLFFGDSDGINTLFTPITRYCFQANAQFGFSVSDAGDVNNDSYDDVIAGAPYFDKGSLDEGIVYLYIGGGVTISASPVWTGESNQASAYFGYSISGGGNVNGDNYSDIAVGAPYFNKTASNNGQIYIYHGKSSGLNLFPNYTKSVAGKTYQGQSVDIDGDVNNDGYSDLLFACFETFYMLKGSAIGISSVMSWSGEGIGYCATSTTGRRINYCGDLDGDDYDDLMVASRASAQGSYNEGIAYIFHGNPFGLTPVYSDFYEGNRTFSLFGSDADAGDFNGDGFDDFIVGAPLYLDNSIFNGRTFIYYGEGSTCSSITGLLSNTTYTTIDFTWTDDPSILWYNLRWRITGSGVWNYDSTATGSISITGLDSCLNYEYQLQTICPDGGTAWSALAFISTDCFDPCALAPTGLFVTDITSTSVKVHWDAMPGVTNYKIWYRPVGAGSWTKKSSIPNFKTLNALVPGTLYEYKVQSICDGVPGPFSALQNFTTLLRLDSDLQTDALHIYPNPSNGEFIVQLPDAFEVDELFVYEVTGKLIYKLPLDQHGNTILYIILPDQSAAGIYYLQVIGNGKQLISPIIKE